MEDLESLFEKKLADPDLDELFPMALARMVIDVHQMEQLVDAGNFGQASFLAYKLHGIATLFNIDDFAQMLTKIIEHLDQQSPLARALLADMADKARVRLDAQS